MVVVGGAMNVKHAVSGCGGIVQEDITVINLLLYSISRKIGSYSMAETMMCILSCDAVPSPKFPRHLSYVVAPWSGTLPTHVVGYFFSRLITEECDCIGFCRPPLTHVCLHASQPLYDRTTVLLLVIWVAQRGCTRVLTARDGP